MRTNRASLVNTIRKLLRLAASGDSPEALSAQSEAERLMTLHKIVVNIEMHRETVPGAGVFFWRSRLLLACAKMHNCRLEQHRKTGEIALLGEYDDAVAAKRLYKRAFVHIATAGQANMPKYLWARLWEEDNDEYLPYRPQRVRVRVNSDNEFAEAFWMRCFALSASDTALNFVTSQRPAPPPPQAVAQATVDKQKEESTEIQEEMKKLGVAAQQIVVLARERGAACMSGFNWRPEQLALPESREPKPHIDVVYFSARELEID